MGGDWLGWLIGLGIAGLLLFQCATAPDTPTDYHGPDCVVVYYSNGPMCE